MVVFPIGRLTAAILAPVFVFSQDAVAPFSDAEVIVGLPPGCVSLGHLQAFT